jgi:molecular chaperone DnaK
VSGSSTGAVLEKPSTIVTRTESEPQLGGEGSGFPPRFLVATGSLGHSIIGIDIGSHWTRVASVVQDEPRLISPPVSSLLALMGVDIATDSVVQIGPKYSMLELIGTDWDLEASQSESKTNTMEQLLDRFLTQLIEHSQKSAEHLIKKCVLTVPSSFTCERRKMLREVVEKAGLEVLNLINEPTAAALAYVHYNAFIEGNVLVVGMGANHFATSLIETRNGLLETRATSADNNLGGQNFDNCLIEYFFQQFEEKYKTPLPRVTANVEKFKKEAERAKLDLSMADQTFVRFIGLEAIRNKLDFNDYTMFLQVERQQFEKMTRPLIEKAIQHIRDVVLESRLNLADVDYVIPVGSASQMPILMNALKEMFPDRVNKVLKNLPFAAAMGAALQASIITRTLKSMVVWDVLAVPICAELPDGTCKTIISRGTPLPVTGYHQVESNDATVNLHILQGYSSVAAENCSIAEVTVNNCPPTATAGTKVEIAVMVRADGTVEFSARHVELQGNLPVTVRRGHPTSYVDRSFEIAPPVKPAPIQDPKRFSRLCRKLNMNENDTLATLRSLKYSQTEIDNGLAVETLIKKLNKRKTKRKAQD